MELLNLKFIREELSNAGFKSDLTKQVELEAAKGFDKFCVDFTESFKSLNNQEAIDFQMYFKLYERLDMHFPFAYKGTLQSNPERSQIFRLGGNVRIHAREAFNLLEGRAVRKQLTDRTNGTPYVNWFQLDFNSKDIHGNYKYHEFRKEAGKLNLASELIKANIKQFQSWDDRIKMVKRLCRGDILQITLMRQTTEVSVLVQASPKGNETEFFNLDKKHLLQSEVTNPNQKKTTPEKVPRRRLKVKGL